jgi:hypothetical protein
MMNDRERKELTPRPTASRSIGKLNLEIDSTSLQQVVASGRLLEFAGTVANEAAAQISAQIVDRLAEAAVAGKAVGGVSVGVAFVFEGGDFGTVPPRPKWGILQTEMLSRGLLQQVAAMENVR